MPCYKPLQAFYNQELFLRTGKKNIYFGNKVQPDEVNISIPCGQCIGCRLDRSKDWAVRCVHEASLHKENCFVTLTFNNENLPDNFSLDHKLFQDFMKRLRKKFPDKGIRYYMCGEYGSKNFRPHYHAILFGIDFPDKVLHRVKFGSKLYTSEILSKLWPYGFSTIGSVTFESAAYVSRYVMKKITGDMANDHYKFVDFDTGVISEVLPEYNRMSLKPGIASKWFDKFGKEVFPSDSVVLNGFKLKPPRYYEKKFELESPEDLEALKCERRRSAVKWASDNTKERLAVKERVKSKQL